MSIYEFLFWGSWVTSGNWGRHPRLFISPLIIINTQQTRTETASWTLRRVWYIQTGPGAKDRQGTVLEGLSQKVVVVIIWQIQQDDFESTCCLVVVPTSLASICPSLVLWSPRCTSLEAYLDLYLIFCLLRFSLRVLFFLHLVQMVWSFQGRWTYGPESPFAFLTSHCLKIQIVCLPIQCLNLWPAGKKVLEKRFGF